MTGEIDPWGHPRRHYSEPTFEPDRAYFSERWERTLEAVAPGSRESVTRAVEAWNQRVRNQLSTEIGFQLKGRQVPVRVLDGLPAPLSELLDPADRLAEIVLNQRLLRGVVAGTRFMESVRNGVRGPTGEVVGAGQSEGDQKGKGNRGSLAGTDRGPRSEPRHSVGSAKTFWVRTTSIELRLASSGWRSVFFLRCMVFP